ncbi:hypothetical protein B0I35DRAFT_279506 [Stachybotrys elegans]|uniref:Uncharacterized protein n=1 Tax=Stachybotrys elegans TaxID=80388 RepID=A0A8K0WPJ0_9HYPO|nr:hypothetical protein B0I35DRAFT_279506 [Stachybotrys elegans]
MLCWGYAGLKPSRSSPSHIPHTRLTALVPKVKPGKRGRSVTCFFLPMVIVQGLARTQYISPFFLFFFLFFSLVVIFDGFFSWLRFHQWAAAAQRLRALHLKKMHSQPLQAYWYCKLQSNALPDEHVPSVFGVVSPVVL